jgi:nitrate reductase NapE component
MATTQHHTRSKATMTTASGLMIFASVMLFVSGVLDILRGVMAIAQDDVFVTSQNYVFKFDLTSWGWIHLALGAVAVVVSLGLFTAATWARVVGVGIAALLIIANFLDIPYYPVWSLTLIALYGFVIWALCVAGPDTDTE